MLPHSEGSDHKRIQLFLCPVFPGDQYGHHHEQDNYASHYRQADQMLAPL